MSQSYIDQITLECLLNKEVMGKHVMKQRERQINKQEVLFYQKRILQLFTELLEGKQIGDDDDYMFPDVKFAFDSFIKTSIEHFKMIDNNDLLQEDYIHIHTNKNNDDDNEDDDNDNDNNDDNDEDDNDNNDEDDDDNNDEDDNDNNDEDNNNNTDNYSNMLICRQVKMECSNLDNYVSRKYNKDPSLIIPKQREVNLFHPTLQNKGLTENRK